MQKGHLVAALAAALLLASCCLVVAQEPVNAPGYNCPKACSKNPNCHCASHEIPGGLRANDIPQFVVLTNDDAITITTMPVILDITEQHENPQGCKIPATWFVSINYTDYHLVQEVYMKGHEIATHTLYHVANPDLFQIVGAKLWLNQTAHVPLEKIRGFRAPFLIHNPEQREILQQNGFLYDSSIPEPFPTATSPDGNTRLWPYTMDYGLPQRCDLGTGPCSVNESLPGLWEFPMWDIQDDAGTVLTNMDPQGDLFEAYKREFDRSYYGNRAPVGVYIHAAWLMDPVRARGMNEFIQYALGHENVWFATISEVIDWMKNPQKNPQYADKRWAEGCNPPTDMWFPSGKYCKAVQCVNGNFSDVECACTCIAEFIPQQPGFCIDSTTGACTVSKEWDPEKKAFYCPDHAKRAPPKTDASDSAAQDPSLANCGHPLQDFVGLGISGTEDNSALYSQALRAVDGLCSSCATAADPQGNYFTVVLPQVTDITSVQLLAGAAMKGTFLFVGNSNRNNGMDNPVCAMNVDLPANQAVQVSCNATGKYVTLASPGTLTICDIYVQGTPSATQLPAETATPTPVPETSGAPVVTGAETSNQLVDSLLSGGAAPTVPAVSTSEPTFSTTSAEGGDSGKPAVARAGADGVNPEGDLADVHATMTQQLMDMYETEVGVIEANRKAAASAAAKKASASAAKKET